MKQITRAAGTVRIHLPDSAGDVTDVPSASSSAQEQRTRSRSQTPTTSEATSALDIELSEMIDALTDEDSPVANPLAEIDRFNVDVGEGTAATPPTGARGSGDGAGDSQELNIDVDLQPGQSAVVLIEQEGTYEWHYPVKTSQARQGSRGADPEQEPEADSSQAVFRIPIGSSSQPPLPGQGARGSRGPITNFIKGKIQGVILKFVARKTLGALTRRLERGVSEGPIVVNSSSDALQWTPASELPNNALPTEGIRRILLLLHGTFSSTVGSFGALTTYPEGQNLLQSALDNYDLVIGFDHYTLSETPEQNAEALLIALLPLISEQVISEQGNLEIDAICFSRGGLVYRYLSEVLIPDAASPIVCRKAIFVACTNNGTELANDENWKHLLDFYTNMIAGSTRLIGFAPGAALPARILRQSIKAIGSMVTYIAQEGVSNNAVPGIAAMEPEGDFVKAINTISANRTLPGARDYYALGSNFEPGGNDEAFRFGKLLVLKVADAFVDRLMARDNDLVVNNDSMFMIDPARSARLVEKRSVNANGRIYHTVYFHQGIVADCCAQWLEFKPDFSAAAREAISSRDSVTS